MTAYQDRCRAALVDAGQQWISAREAERQAATTVYREIQQAAAEGIAETEIARLAGVDRMTVRRALGKR